MKITLNGWQKTLIGLLPGSIKDLVLAFLNSDLLASWTALKAIPDALKSGNIDLAESYGSAFLAHLPSPVKDLIVRVVQKNFPAIAAAVSTATAATA